MAKTNEPIAVELRIPKELGLTEKGIRSALDDEFVKKVTTALTKKGAMGLEITYKVNGPKHPPDES
jgi:hypothetical protein